jgi:hypothetical protein
MFILFTCLINKKMSTSFPFHFEELDTLLKRFSGNTDKRKIQIRKILKEAYRLRRKDTCEPFMPASEAEWINFFFSPGIIRKNNILEQCQVYFPVRLDDCAGSTVSSSKSGVKIQGYSALNYRQKSIEVTRLEKLFFNCSRILDILAHSFISGTAEAGFVKEFRRAKPNNIDKPILINIDTLESIESFIGRFKPSAQEKDNPVLFFEKICRTLCVTVNPLVQHRSSGTLTIDPLELQKDGFVLKNSDSIYTPNKWLVIMENKIFLLSSIVFLKKNGKLKVIRLQAETKKISKLMQIYSKLIAAEQRYQGPEFYDTFKKFFVKNFALIDTSKNKPFKYKETRDLSLKFVLFDRLTLYLVPEMYEPLQQKYSITREEYNSKIKEYNNKPSSGTTNKISNYTNTVTFGLVGYPASIEDLNLTKKNVEKNIGLICASTAGKCLNQFSYKNDDGNDENIEIYPEETKQIFTFRYSCKFLKKQETELPKENFFEYSHFDEEKSGVERKKNIEDISEHIKKAFGSLIFSNEIAIAYASFFHEFISFGILEVELLPVNLTPEELNSINKINDLPKNENKLEKLFEILGINTANNNDDQKIKECLKTGQSATFLVKKDTKFYNENKIETKKWLVINNSEIFYTENDNTKYLKNLETQGFTINYEFDKKLIKSKPAVFNSWNRDLGRSIAATPAPITTAAATTAAATTATATATGAAATGAGAAGATNDVENWRSYYFQNNFKKLLGTQDDISEELQKEIKENLVYTLKPIDKKVIKECLQKVTDEKKVKKIIISLRLLGLITISERSWIFFRTDVPEKTLNKNAAAVSYLFKKFKYEEYFKILSRFYKNYTKHMTDGVLFTFNKLMNSQELFPDMHRMTEDCICQKRFKVGIVQLLDQFKPTAPTMQLTGPDEVLLVKVLKLDNDLITKSLSNKEKFFENVCDHITRENEYLLKIKPVLYHKLVAINKVKIIRVILDAFKYIRKVLIEQNNKMGLDFILKENLIIFQIMNQYKEKGFREFIWSKLTKNNIQKLVALTTTALLIKSMFAPPPPDENLPPLDILDYKGQSILPSHPNYTTAALRKEIAALDKATEAAHLEYLQKQQAKNLNAEVDSQFKSDAFITGALTSFGGALTSIVGGLGLSSVASTVAGMAYDNPLTSLIIGGGLGLIGKYYQQKVSTNVTPTENEVKIATEIKTREKLAHHAQELIQRGKHDEVLSDDIIQAFNNVMEMYKNSSKIIFQHESIIPEVIVFIGNEYNYSQKRKEKLEAQNETDFSINEKLEAYISSQVAQLASAYEAMPEAQRLKINQSNWKNGIIENFFSLATQGFYLYNIYGALTSGSLGYAGQTLLGLTHSAYRGFGVDYSTNNGRQPPLLAANRRINDAHPKPHNDAKHRDAVNHYLRYANHRA